jgi:hypothetical protein
MLSAAEAAAHAAAAADEAGKRREEQAAAGASHDGEAARQAPELQQLFTLPFALHLEPLPHLSYRAAHSAFSDTSGSDSDEELDPDAPSDRGSAAIRVKKRLDAAPPHALHEVSYLLAHTRALEAVTDLTQLVRLLDGADEDPGFATLRAFFDARFDREGRLVSGPRSPRSPRRRGSLLSRRPSAPGGQLMGSAAGRSRTLSSTSAAGGGFRTRVLRTLSRDGAASEISEDDFEEAELRAPEIQAPPRRATGTAHAPVPGQQDRSVRFSVRLDLHSVGLAPLPPQPPPRRPSRPMLDTQILSSPSRRGRRVPEQVLSPTSQPAGNDLERARTASSAVDLFGAGSLREVSSRESSTSAARQRSPPSPSQGRFASAGLAGRNRQAASRPQTAGSSFTMDHDVFGAVADAGDAVPSSEEPVARARSSTQSRGETRRPSFLQRFFGQSRSTRRGSSNSTAPSLASSLDLPDASSAATSASIAEEEGLKVPVTASIEAPSRRMRSATVVSDLSNDEAIDTGDEDGSLYGSLPARMLGVDGPRRASLGSVLSASNMSASQLAGTAGIAAQLQPVTEGAVADWSEMRAPPELLSPKPWAGGDDFLTLLRKAADTALNVDPSARILSEKARGKRPAAHSGSITPSSSGADTPLGQPTDQAPPDTSAWWLCGRTDPSTIAVPCAFGEALGWEGILHLCYGPGSASARAGDFVPLGKAAEMDSRQQSESAKVQQWARGVESSTDSTFVARSASSPVPGSAGRDLGLSHVAEDASDVAPSESASTKAVQPASDETRATQGASALEKLLQRMPGRSASTPPALGGDSTALAPAAALAALQLGGERQRTWADWTTLAVSMQGWVEQYEATRVREGLAHEMVAHSAGAGRPTPALPSGADASGLPDCVLKDALDATNGFRRRGGIPPSLASPDGIEHQDYHWASSRLHAKHFASALSECFRDFTAVPLLTSTAHSSHGRLLYSHHLAAHQCAMDVPLRVGARLSGGLLSAHAARSRALSLAGGRGHSSTQVLPAGGPRRAGTCPLLSLSEPLGRMAGARVEDVAGRPAAGPHCRARRLVAGKGARCSGVKLC